MNQTRSILDSVNGKLASLKKELGASDQSRVMEYTDAVRDVERRRGYGYRTLSRSVPARHLPRLVCSS